jgi:hypothetical protein
MVHLVAPDAQWGGSPPRMSFQSQTFAHICVLTLNRLYMCPFM